jgi:phosphate transport system permease protein
MAETSAAAPPLRRVDTTSAAAQARIKARYRTEARFRTYGLISIILAGVFLAVLMGRILISGLPAFTQHALTATVTVQPTDIAADGSITPQSLKAANWNKIARDALGTLVPAAQSRADKKSLYKLLSAFAGDGIRDALIADPSKIGKPLTLSLPISAGADLHLKGDLSTPLPDEAKAWLDRLHADGRTTRNFNWAFFLNGDSREPDVAGIRGALVGTLLTLAVTLALVMPVGVLAAVYLQEFAPRNRWTELIEININNLAAVPSIVFGLLGLAVFLNAMGLPRSAPLVGGLVLALMVLPTIIIASRAALGAVPPSIRAGALALGASEQQAVFHHVLPLAVPGIMTGTIIGTARAIGETAPLLMIGMIAFIVDVPSGLSDAATVLPVQVYLWSDLPEAGFQAKTSAAIIVLLAVLLVLNAAAVWLRSRFETRW